MEKECLGLCPKCGSENINWYDSELQNNFVIYNAQCDDCNCEFSEEYKLVYNITTY